MKFTVTGPKFVNLITIYKYETKVLYFDFLYRAPLFLINVVCTKLLLRDSGGMPILCVIEV